ncbi:cell envelope integrity protein CreD [Aeromonas cavernicola]|uniref:Cell envelope integrity protein CreD n=1 Tax=Aeromonas cavernicola TaxID=1006623 RepID=A0A2H9U3X8_9GAMM|nr:cell envelope integrity protein CreD [Aeromonas cavernicola]PJG58733.1 cell envelope integrity protein CreD [Aeromonas cavernicola]
MLKHILTHKITLLILLGLLLMLPMQSIRDLNQERQAYRTDAIDQIMASASGPQQLIGPVLVLPYSREVKVQEGDKVKMVRKYHARFILPEQLNAQVKLEVTPRRLGIYQAQVYQTNISLTGTLPANPDWQLPEGAIADEPYLSMALSDARGISQIPSVTLSGHLREVLPGAHISDLAGVHVPLPAQQPQGGDFAVQLTLQGMEKFSLVPVGRNSHLTMEGNWPHPSFLGDFLPTRRDISKQGFTANWQTSWFATDMANRFDQIMVRGTEQLPSFSISLVQPVDHYQQNERAAKYALLFIGLTFISFFMFELLRGLRVHPIQYALVGMGLAIFYLVLLALTEHLGFAWAYLCAALASVMLNGFYLSHILGGFKPGAGFSILLGLVYALLFGLLQAEDMALLLGALLLFLVLALVMVLTRKLDWYQVMGNTTTD